jgi:tetratricopeptide (TPR) repeat protein
VLAVVEPGTWSRRAGRLGLVATVLIGAVIVLWAFYGFRYRDSVEAGEFFNRPLVQKIEDIRSPVYKTLLHWMTDGHLFPTSYIWGLADTIRAGAEGRAASIYAFGKLYYSRAPFYYTPGIWAAKLPLGLLVLTILGLVLLAFRRLPKVANLPLAGLALLAGLFWLALATGSTYGGVRHALSVLPLLAVLGALGVAYAMTHPSVWLRGAVGVAGLAAVIAGGFVIRPWEYFNELAGGTANSYQYFNDEGVDLFQRSTELVQYYKKNVAATGEKPFIWYGISRSEKKQHQMHWVGEIAGQDSILYQSDRVTGTFFVSSLVMSPNLYNDDYIAFRAATPVARMGNLLVYRGTFRLPNLRASWLSNQGYKALYVESKPNPAKAERYLAEAVALNPKIFFIDWELGNLYVQRRARREAIQAFTQARTYCPNDDLKEMLAAYLKRLETEDLSKISTLRNPAIE